MCYTLLCILHYSSRLVTKATGESAARQVQAVCTLLVGLALGFYASWKVVRLSLLYIYYTKVYV